MEVFFINLFYTNINRIIFRINLYKWILVDRKKEIKYRYRLDGLINSIKGNSSSLRIENL